MNEQMRREKRIDTMYKSNNKFDFLTNDDILPSSIGSEPRNLIHDTVRPANAPNFDCQLKK